MSDPRINDADVTGPGGEFVEPTGQEPDEASSGDSMTGHRSPDDGDGDGDGDNPSPS